MPDSRPKAPRALIALVTVLQIGLGLIAAGIYNSSHNTLYNNGNWTSTKTTLAGGIMGAQSYVFNLQALAGGRLGLSAWYGFQEVVSKREFDPAAIQLTFLVKEQGHLTVEFNRTERAFVGIRASASERFPPVVLRATAEGEFLYKKPFRKLRRAGDLRWHRMLIRFEEDKAFTVFLDGRRLETFPLDVIRPQRIGFRGSTAGVFVKEVRVTERNGSVFTDDFRRPANWRLVVVLAVGGVLLFFAVLFFGLRRILPISDKILLFYFLMFSVVAIVVGLLFSGIAWHRTKFYPNATERRRAVEAAHIETGAERMVQRVEKAYSQVPEAGVERVLFVGSSQTRGAGAAKPRHTLVRRTERLLNRRAAGGKRFECLNVAVRGFKIERMRQDLEQRWVHWKPDVIIVNAGNNNVGSTAEEWDRELTAIVRAGKSAGSRVVLIPEANSIERPSAGLDLIHRTTREVAAREGVPVIEMFEHLSRRADDGFLWWDWVHLTSYGHELFAEYLVSELDRLGVVELKTNPAEAPATLPSGIERGAPAA